MTTTIRRYTPAIGTALASLGVAALTGLTIITYTSAVTSSKILARQDRLITDVSNVSTLVMGLQTKDEADDQYSRLNKKIEELKARTMGIDKRVRSLEMNK